MAPVADYAGGDPSGLVCTTPACLGLAAEILFNLADNYTEFDPCTDFDKLACNGFRAKRAPSPGTGQAATFTSEPVRVILKYILEGPYPSGPGAGFISESLSEDQVAVDRDNFKLLTDAYNACLNNTAAEEAGLGPLIAFIDHIVDAFPKKASTDLITGSDDLGEVLLIFAQHSISTFEVVAPQWNDIDTNKVVIAVQPAPARGSLLNYVESKETLAKYLAVQASVLQAVHPGNLTDAEAEKLASKVTEFESNFIGLNKFDDTRPGEYEPAREFTLDEVTSVAPELGHDLIIKSLSPPGYVPDALYFSPGYFGNLSALLANTTAGTLKGYFVWQAAATLSGYVEDEAAGRLSDLRSTLRGLDPKLVGRRARWQRCVSDMETGAGWVEASSGLGWVLGRFFVDRTYSEASRELTGALMDSIRDAFVARLADNDWLSPGVKKVAEEKARSITDKIGYPDASPNTTDPQDMAGFYGGLAIGGSYFDNTIETASWFTAKTWSWLGKPTDRQVWLDSPSVVNAYYFPTFNDIAILAGIQQRPLYDVGYPSYINYGGMGAVLGHELTHGFDNAGHHFAPNGSLAAWFDESSERAFDDRARCFAEQYGRFSVAAPNGTRVRVRGNATLGENIADAGGLITAFAAWKSRKAGGGVEDPDLPGLGAFTHDQLFFVQYAQSWCDVSGSPAFDVWLINNDPHSPGFARINGPLSNSAEFREAFDCPVKEAECKLW
ncbi:endothelin-converting enzyme 1 [Colletotrichum falcatum]|nr:endothelin-converting enzyme 1 [Colletotrichum falcatum]